MEYDKRIGEMEEGDQILGFYMLKTAQGRISTNGRPYLAALLGDCTGQIDAKAWDYGGPVGQGDEGQIVRVRGKVTEYRGILQLIVEQIRLAGEGDRFNLDNLVPTAPIDPDAAMKELYAMVDTIQDPDCHRLCQTMLRRWGTQLKQIPAGKSVHHSFLHGLLMHTSTMLYIADFLSDVYRDTVNRSLLLTGTLLHDIAKVKEFTFSSVGLVTEYSVPGQLLGHLALGAEEVAQTAKEVGMPEEKSVMLQHMILSHHGSPEFGSVVPPMCAEAELLSSLDFLDSRMEIYREMMEETPPGQFSKKIFALNRRVYHHGIQD